MNQRDQKRQNLEAILSLLRTCPETSQAEIATLTGLQPSSVSYLVRLLKDSGIVHTTRKGSSGPFGGKKADLLSLRAEYGTFGGIFIKNEEILSCLSDFAGTIVSRKRLDTQQWDDEQILKAIIQEIRANAEHNDNYRGSGIAVSSIVTQNGNVTKSRYFNHAIPHIIAQIRSQTPDLPLVVENDANCAAYFDHIMFRDRFRNLVHLHVPTKPFTIGAGIIIDDRLYRGASGAAGEIPESNGPVAIESEIERVMKFMATVLDTQAVFITGEFDDVGRSRVRKLAARIAASGQFAVEFLDNPDIPLLGASLQAIRLHIDELLKDGRVSSTETFRPTRLTKNVAGTDRRKR